jgi:hypothetical protein
VFLSAANHSAQQSISKRTAYLQLMEEGEGKMGWKHWGLMLLCCLPMIVIANLIVVGAWGVR